MIWEFPFRLSEPNRTSRNTCLTNWNKPTAPAWLYRQPPVSSVIILWTAIGKLLTSAFWSVFWSTFTHSAVWLEQRPHIYFVTSLWLRQDRVNVLSGGFVMNVITVTVTEQAHPLSSDQRSSLELSNQPQHIAQNLKHNSLWRGWVGAILLSDDDVSRLLPRVGSQHRLRFLPPRANHSFRQRDRRSRLTTREHLAPKLRMSGAVHLLSVFMAWAGMA